MTDPHVNPATGVWDDNWYANVGKYGGSSGNPAIDAQNNALAKYISQQQGFYQTGNDLQNALLQKQNTQALGTQHQSEQQDFLNSVLSPQQTQQGSIQYGYGLTQGNENNVYGLNTTANTQNRQMALSKLANDENWANKNLNLQQGQQNENTLESLNQRGLLYGQKPTGGFQPEALGGMSGVAGQQAGLVNTDFANQRGQLQTDYGLNTQDVNQQSQQQQNMLNQNHTFNTSMNAFNTANDINQQNNQNTFQSGMNANQLAMYKASLANQQAQGVLANKLAGQQLYGSNYQ